ncbi:MAG: urease accessory protein UreF [Leptolyngbya sp. UWPOB_LEPTO1]|uniref:urease accessory protein UreF n=1 Tax=Leptolyngbya sp. UWPOB_LEPTO1 TaxID=2815653 RepID=UPI001AC010B7|nr:urease accessory protein UreF [Leptolyngbya sp. UWPOB_LEPTO1]MBN8561860.1 urease accessory protein UreF [Leptolyngbya sp. UWPOB_LEPTO1]
MDTLTKLLQLASPALPVGAYSYSEGLETLVHSGVIHNVDALEHWIIQELNCGAVRLEAAMMLRSYRATLNQEFDRVLEWNQWFTAARETEELRSQSLQMGGSLLRLFRALYPEPIPNFPDGCNFAIAFGLVAALWEIEESSALLAYLHSWATNLVSAGVKLIPLGQTSGQKLLLKLGEEMGKSAIADLSDDELETCGWGFAIASMSHETLYSRLFRS